MKPTIKNYIKGCFFLVLLQCLLITPAKAKTFLFSASLLLPLSESERQGKQQLVWKYFGFYYNEETLFITSQGYGGSQSLTIPLNNVVGITSLQEISHLVYFTEQKIGQQKKLRINKVKINFLYAGPRESIQALHRVLYPDLREESVESLIDYRVFPVINTSDAKASKAHAQVLEYLDLLPFRRQRAIMHDFSDEPSSTNRFSQIIQERTPERTREDSYRPLYVFLTIGENPSSNKMAPAIKDALQGEKGDEVPLYCQSYFVSMGGNSDSLQKNHAYNQPEEMLYAVVQIMKAYFATPIK